MFFERRFLKKIKKPDRLSRSGFPFKQAKGLPLTER